MKSMAKLPLRSASLARKMSNKRQFRLSMALLQAPQRDAPLSRHQPCPSIFAQLTRDGFHRSNLDSDPHLQYHCAGVSCLLVSFCEVCASSSPLVNPALKYGPDVISGKFRVISVSSERTQVRLIRTETEAVPEEWSFVTSRLPPHYRFATPSRRIPAWKSRRRGLEDAWLDRRCERRRSRRSVQGPAVRTS